MEQKKGNNKIFIVIGIIIIFAIVVFAIINIQNKDNNNNGTSILNNKKDELISKTEHTYGNSQTNINNSGLIVGDNENIYHYQNHYQNRQRKCKKSYIKKTRCYYAAYNGRYR